MSKIPKILCAALLLLGLFRGSASEPRTAFAENVPANRRQVFKVALLLPRAVDADGWTRAGYTGLKLIEEKLHAEIAYTESVPEDKFEDVFRQYAQEGSDFIIGHGGQFIPAAEVVAEEFPRTKFAVTSKYAGNNKNFGALSTRSTETGYLTGVVAAIKTTTKQIAYIGGQPHESAQEMMLSFERGVHAIDPTIEVSPEWVGNWSDEARAIQLAQKQIEAGADVLAVNVGKAGLAVHPLAEQVGVYTIGWIEDQYELAPKAVLTSFVQDYSIVLLRGAELAHAGRWEGKLYRFGLREGVQSLAPFRGMLSPGQETQVLVIQDDIIRGTIDLTP
ncbi:MAG: BMP family ABC transporter substrate-binding protein [bacterium]|nr:BMP family ABC transporter substrate-binding protein [bacterium]